MEVKTMSKKKVEVDKIIGKSIYFDKNSGMFEVEIGEREFKATSLDRLKLDVKDSHTKEVDIPVYYDSSGDLIATKIVRVTTDEIILSRYRAGMGVNPNLYREDFFKDIFPITEKNKKIFKKNQELRDKGWKLIHKASELVADMDKFDKKHFDKEVKPNSSP
jgi:hypothetical protein